MKEVLATHTRGEIEWWLSSDGQSIRGGKNWRVEVEQALHKCKIVFILFTQRSRQSAWVQYEAGFADALDKEIIPVALPGFDIDQIPGPLQHKQGFNLRDHSGLNNIISHVNRILSRSYLLTLEAKDYERVFSGHREADELPRLLDFHFENIELESENRESALDALADQACKQQGEFVVYKKQNKTISGTGFIFEERFDMSTQQTQPPGNAKPIEIFKLKGEISPLVFLEVLPLLSTVSSGVKLTWKLRRGFEVLPQRSQILARMKGTSMRWADKNVFQYAELRFATRSYDNNATRVYLFSRLKREPEPYRPEDRRYELTIQWENTCPENTVRELLALLIERQIIYSNE